MEQAVVQQELQRILVDKIKQFERYKIKIGVSNHHVHLSRHDTDILFGKDYALTKKI